jgi:hypothetical protein
MKRARGTVTSGVSDVASNPRHLAASDAMPGAIVDTDARIVRMSELYERHAVFTLDSDFSVYRKHGRLPLTLIHPA